MRRRIPSGAIELRIYRGADGEFKLYDDAGDSYDYEKGQHAVIPIRWNDSAECSDDRRARRLLSGNGGEARVPGCAGWKRVTELAAM